MELLQHADEKVEQQQPTLLAAEAAQRIYNNPRDTLWVMSEMHHQLNDYYHDMLTSDRARALYLRERAIWVASLAPLLHRAELTLMRAVLPLMQRGESFYHNLPPGETIYDGAEAYSKLDRRPFTSARRDFIYAVSAWTVGVGKQIKHEPAVQSMWLGHAGSHQAFCEQERKYRSYQRPVSPDAHFLEVLADGNDVPMELLDDFREHYGRGLSPQECKQAFLSRVDEFAWGASVRRRFLIDWIVNHWKSEGKCPYSKADEVATNGIWRVASLRGGPWKIPGFCPANIVLRPPADEDRGLINQLRELCGQEPSDKGASAVWMHLVFGAHLAAETLWAEED